MSPAADADIPAGTTVLGKSIEDIQDGVTVGDDNTITGTLKYITGWTEYSDDPAEQSGNYLVLHLTPADAVAVYDGETHTADENGYVVIRITDTSLPVTVADADYTLDTDNGNG